MKLLFFLAGFLLLLSCGGHETVYWCGEHACVNKKERESYFKKTMIVEIREVKDKKNKKIMSEFEKIKKQSGLVEDNLSNERKENIELKDNENKSKIENDKELIKQVKLEQKMRIKEEKELAKEIRLEEKRRLKEEKKLKKKAKLEKKLEAKRQKKLTKEAKLQSRDKKKRKSHPKIALENKVDTTNSSSNKFDDIVKKITERNMFKSYPNINDTPN